VKIEIASKNSYLFEIKLQTIPLFFLLFFSSLLIFSIFCKWYSYCTVYYVGQCSSKMFVQGRR